MTPRRIVIAGVAGVIAVAVVVFLLVRGGDEPAPQTEAVAPATATATTAAPCQPARTPYGTAPGGFAYEHADEATRAKTVKALGLDESGGKVDMRLARRAGITLGSLVGVPSQDPDGYVGQVVQRAQSSGAKVQPSAGFDVISLANGASIAIGSRGCRAVLITSQDPNGMRYLAAAVFGG